MTPFFETRFNSVDALFLEEARIILVNFCDIATVISVGRYCSTLFLVFFLLYCALAAAQYTVIGPVRLFVCGVCVCVCVCVCLRVCYHDNLKLRASILTKLGL